MTGATRLVRHTRIVKAATDLSDLRIIYDHHYQRRWSAQDGPKSDLLLMIRKTVVAQRFRFEMRFVNFVDGFALDLGG